MCAKPARFRGPLFADRRDIARDILRSLALSGPDPFTLTDAFLTQPARTYNGWSAVGWLRDHGFFACVEVRSGKRLRWELSEQAIRWLDWTGFDWSVRKVA